MWTSLQIDTIWWPDVVPPTKTQITNQTSSGHIRDCHASGRIKQAGAISNLYAGTLELLYKQEQEGGNTRACELELKWLPGDLRFHIKNEAQRSRSRSPPSLAAQEEHDDAESSSDFLLAVTSCAAAANTDALTNNGAIETLHNKLRSRLTATLTPAEESILDMNDTKYVACYYNAQSASR